jgi:hypothetical protein
MINTITKQSWLKEKGLVFFMPSIFRMIKLWFHRPIGPEIQSDFVVTCFWISSGTWGGYRPPDKIFICPHKIPNLEKVIRHEITHLQHDKDVLGLEHEQKEDYINAKEAEYYN